MRLTESLLVVLLVGGIASCGSGGDGDTGPGASGVEKSKAWSALTMAERAALCDWAAAKFGGYGMSMDCGNGTSVGANASQQACIDNVPPTCSATVAQFEQCTNDTTCASGGFAPSCAPLLACYQTAGA